ncbi:unnamed protein product [Tilletia controversa]|nr:unnamed protein product [Tilletia controversa]CAD6976734.1 unnamed protein product [Tilletia controversa]
MSVHRSLFTLPPSAPHHNDSADFPASHLAALQLQPITRPKSLSRTILAQDKHKGGVHAITGRALKAQGVQEAARRFGLRVLEGADYIPGIGKIDSSVDEEGESSDEDAAPLDPHRSDDVDDGHNPILWPRVHSDGEPEEEIDDAATTTTATTLSKASSSAITPLQQSLLSSPPLKTGTLLLLGGGNFAAAVIALNPFVELSLLGSSEQAASFISQYVAQRFPNAPRSQPQPQPSGAGAGASSSPSSQPRQQQAKQHGKQKLTTPKQRLLQPATAKRVVKETPEAFGPVGTVYHKDKDFVLDGYRRPAVITAPHGPASVPTPPPTSENEAASTSYQQPTLIAAAEQQPTADVTAPELETIAPTAAMRELDALLAELVVSEDNQGSAPPELVLCFCQAAVVTPDEADESDDDDADADLGSSAVEVTITILVPDTDDDGWPALAHQAPSSLSSAADVDEAQQAAIQRQRAMARTVGGHRPLANPRLEAGSRPTYTARKEREARRAEQHRRASTDTPTRERDPKLGRMIRRVPLAQPTAGHEPFETLVAGEVHSGEGDVTPEDGGAAARRFLC